MKLTEKKNTVLVTGSSGYVASELIPRLSDYFSVVGVDKRSSLVTDTIMDISSSDFQSVVDEMPSEGVSIVNLAAARFDFGADARDYYDSNVSCHEIFLRNLKNVNIERFIHISSVASFDGRKISYSDRLECDDAYRSTKYLQEKLIRDWCEEAGVELVILYPSAIFSKDLRSDTNIGKMQSITKVLPFIPLVNADKSVTYLPNFADFIVNVLLKKIPYGRYLTIEKPVLSVSTMIQIISGRRLRVIRIPWFKNILQAASYFLYLLGGFGKLDLKLTPNRVVKLFNDTSYSYLSHEQVDLDEYSNQTKDRLPDILKNFNQE